MNTFTFDFGSPTSLCHGDLFVIATKKYFKYDDCAQLINSLIKMSKTIVKSYQNMH